MRAKLVELSPSDAFYGSEYAVYLIGREFEGQFLFEFEEHEHYRSFSGKLVGEGLFPSDEGKYDFAYAHFEVLSKL